MSNGEINCFLAISVLCEPDSSRETNDCAYHLTINQRGYNYTERISKAVHPLVDRLMGYPPPNAILEEAYINGNVSYNKVKYHYFPISKKDYGNSLILLNKTQIFGRGENGDSRMLINLQSNTSDNADEGLNYTDWTYPNDNRAGAISYTLNNTWPEIIEPCEDVMKRLCNDTDGCTFLIGVAGGT